MNQKGIVLPPLLIWAVIVVGSILIAQDVVKRGYISIDLSGGNVETVNVPATTVSPTPTPTLSPTSTPTFVPTQKPTFIPTAQPIKKIDPAPKSLPLLNGANIFYFINGYRSQNGKPELQLSDELCQYAQQRADLIAREDPRLEKSSLMHHYKFKEFVDSVGNGDIFGENINVNSPTESQVLEGWKNSPPHNELMLANSFPDGATYTGGCVRSAATSEGNNATVFLVGGK